MVLAWVVVVFYVAGARVYMLHDGVGSKVLSKNYLDELRATGHPSHHGGVTLEQPVESTWRPQGRPSPAGDTGPAGTCSRQRRPDETARLRPGTRKQGAPHAAAPPAKSIEDSTIVEPSPGGICRDFR